MSAHSWWCTGCGSQRDPSAESCPACGGLVMQSASPPSTLTISSSTVEVGPEGQNVTTSFPMILRGPV